VPTGSPSSMRMGSAYSAITVDIIAEVDRAGNTTTSLTVRTPPTVILYGMVIRWLAGLLRSTSKSHGILVGTSA